MPITAAAGETVNAATPTVSPRFASTTFSAATAFDALIAAKADFLGTTPPATDTTKGQYVFAVASGSAFVVCPMGTGADNSQFSLRVWAWYPFSASDNMVTQWKAILLWVGTCTLGTKVGVASGLMSASVRAVDTLTVTNDRAPSGVNQLLQPASADNQQVMLLVDPKGAPYVEVEMAKDGAAATGFNAACFTIPGV